MVSDIQIRCEHDLAFNKIRHNPTIKITDRIPPVGPRANITAKLDRRLPFEPIPLNKQLTRPRINHQVIDQPLNAQRYCHNDRIR